jgi:hypothetical protein
MKRFTGTLLCFLFCTVAHAQINRYVSNTWEEKPHLRSSSATRDACTLLKYIVVRDFNRSIAEHNDLTHYRTIYKRIRINTQAGADSLAQILIPLEPYEKPVVMYARVINTDSTTTVIRGLRVFMKGSIETIRLTPSTLRPGSEIEYDFTISESDGYAGYEYMQSSIPCEKATFMLVLPPNMLFRTRGTNGFPDVQDSIVAGGTHYYHATAYNIPALLPGDLYYYNTWLQRTEFALRESNWQQPAKDQFLAYVFLEKPDYKNLEKEVRKWEFLKTRMPLPDLIYQIEQQIKSQYKLIDDNPDEFEFSDLTTILKTKVCNETGMVKLMASVYYLLGIKSQILFASTKESVPLDSSIINIHLANNILLYFPDLKQALAPAAANTRFPYYPTAWAGTLALRCRDTLIDKKTDVLVDFIQTPVTDYTTNNISLEATLNIDEKGVNDVKIKQTVGGAPSLTIKTIMANTPESGREEIYNSLLPTGQIRVTGLSHKVQHDNWDLPVATSPFIIESSFKTDSLNVGMLINGLVQQYVSMPPENIPVEMAYPFYQESRIIITVPAGYKLTNLNDFILDVHGIALGYKILCKQEDNKITIFAVKWYKKSSYAADEKRVFEKIIEADTNLKSKKLIF